MRCAAFVIWVIGFVSFIDRSAEITRARKMTITEIMINCIRMVPIAVAAISVE